jgi:beta-lactamase regulating signal transducer with metallopeptidase domain
MNATTWLLALLRASLEGGVALLLIWALTRAWPRMPAPARCGLWWLGSLRMLFGLVPIHRIPITLGAARAWPAAIPAPMVELGNAMAGVVTGRAPAATASAPAAAHSPVDALPLALLALWAIGFALAAVLMARRFLAMRRMWRMAVPFDDPRVARWRNEWAVVLGSARLPEVRSSAAVDVPVTIGVVRPGVLLPADSSRLSDDALRAVLAHEMSHVRRRDALFAWVPAAAQIAFWFHPLVRFATREYLAAREEACDADALRASGASPHDYGTLLLDYGVCRAADVPGAASCGSHRSRDLKRRLDMLSQTLRITVANRMRAAGAIVAVVALTFTPIRLVAANEGKSESEAARAALEDAKRQEEKEALEATGRMAHEKRLPMAYMIKIRDEKGTHGSVDSYDMDAARRLDIENQTAVYFRLDEDMYVARDAATLKQVQEALAPEDRLQARQQTIEGRNGRYEQEQARLELQRTVLDQRREELFRRRDALRDEIDNRTKSSRSVEDLRHEVGSLQAEADEVSQRMLDLARSYDVIHSGMKSAQQDNLFSYAEMVKVHEQVMESIGRIARQAVKDGRAVPFEP